MLHQVQLLYLRLSLALPAASAELREPFPLALPYSKVRNKGPQKREKGAVGLWLKVAYLQENMDSMHGYFWPVRNRYGHRRRALPPNYAAATTMCQEVLNRTASWG